MTTESDALPTGSVVERSAGGSGPLSVLEAARSLSQQRYKEQAEAGRQAEATQGEKPADVDASAGALKESTAQAVDAASQETESPSETQEVEAAELPPIDPPRSWSKDEKERFRALPRETQEFLVERESAQEKTFHQRQREATEKSKALEAKEQAAEQVRQQYEQALPLLFQALQEQHQGEFADIKSIADVEKLAREDWPRYVLWDAQQKKIAAVQQQVQLAEQRQQQEKGQKWSSFAKDEDAKFLEKASDLRDADAMTKATKGAIELLQDLGFSDDDLGAMWNGQKDLSLRDHRVQLLIRDGVKYREAQAAAKKVTAAPKPPVQRPGVTPQRGDSVAAQIQNLEKQIATANGLNQIRLAAQLTSLRRSAGAGR